MGNKSIDLVKLTLLVGLIAFACGETNINRSLQAAPLFPETDSLISETVNPSPDAETTSPNSFLPNPKVKLIYSTTTHSNYNTLSDRLTFTTATQNIDSRLKISLSRREVTLYRRNIPVKSYPIGIGRAGWETPLGTFEVQQMRKNPVWIHPFTGERISNGDSRNPLGTRWIGFWTDENLWVGFHGTSSPESVGTAASHGCIRMHNEDVEEIFAQIEIGTPVIVVQ